MGRCRIGVVGGEEGWEGIEEEFCPGEMGSSDGMEGFILDFR